MASSWIRIKLEMLKNQGFQSPYFNKIKNFCLGRRNRTIVSGTWIKNSLLIRLLSSRRCQRLLQWNKIRHSKLLTLSWERNLEKANLVELKLLGKFFIYLDTKLLEWSFPLKSSENHKLFRTKLFNKLSNK